MTTKHQIVVSYLALTREWRSINLYLFIIFILALTAFTYLTVFDFLRYFP